MTIYYYVTPCDKCGLLVLRPEDSALILDDAVWGRVTFNHNRHLFPTANCEGSPSRVKMLQTDPKWQATHQLIKKTEFEIVKWDE